MKKEEVMILAQLLTAMKDSLDELDRAERTGDRDKVLMVKKEILNFQKKIDETL